MSMAKVAVGPLDHPLGEALHKAEARAVVPDHQVGGARLRGVDAAHHEQLMLEGKNKRKVLC